ncbi:MAG: FtsW/RodA/SpoVE family cell cycle protein [Minisyncoccia bacterium]
MRAKHIDRSFLALVCILVFGGLLIFISAALGLLARGGQTVFENAAISQLFFGVICGFIALFALAKIDYRFWKPYTPYFFGVAMALTLLTFVPHIGLSLKGASRWLELGPFSFQPVEVLKFASVALLAAVYAQNIGKIGEWRASLIPLAAIAGSASLVLIMQPNTGGVAMIGLASLTMLFAAGGKMRYIAGIVLVGVALVALLALQRPYLRARFETFFNPSENSLSSSFQVQQSLIAVGSGRVFGRGFGQSIEKFSYLPEPIGDSIFAVAGEEFGFLGTTILVVLFAIFAMAGLRIAARAPDAFGALLVVGLVVTIAGQSFFNMGATLGLFPLAGLPLIFVSHGGTALAIALAEVGVILSVSRQMKNS